jgi:agmatine deiminase
MSATPRALGYHMPAEWEPQEAIWLSWPHNETTWPGALLAEVQRSYAEIIQALHRQQKIKLLVRDAGAEEQVRNILGGFNVQLSQVVFFHIASEDAWIRDYGPTFVVKNGELAMVKWTFNAWGNKYDDLLNDTRIPYELNRIEKLPIFEAGIVLEGGSIEVNGAGTVLTTEQCLLNSNRNPQFNRKDIENYLKDYLGVSRVVWLKEGIVGDDTDGHIDDIARFVDEQTIVCALEDDPSDENYALLQENHELLKETGFRVIKLPMPGFVGDSQGRLPASYANFYIGNGAVVVPQFGHTNDQRALDILRDCFPGRHVVGVNCTAMVHGLGTIHCCSQQEPRRANGSS